MVVVQSMKMLRKAETMDGENRKKKKAGKCGLGMMMTSGADGIQVWCAVR